MNKEALSRKIVGNTTRFLKKNSTIILAIASSVGVCATAYATYKAVPKAMKKVEEIKAERGEELTTIEKVEVAAPYYILPVSLGLCTISCIVVGAVTSTKKERSLIAAYGMASNYIERYRGKVIEKYGKEADIEIRNELARERCDFHCRGLETPDQKVIWYDELSGNTIEAYEREIMDAEYHLNRNFALRGYASLNEFYDFLGMPMTKEGESLGWSSSDGYYWVDFEHRRIDDDEDPGMPIYAIDFIFCPDADYLRDWEYIPSKEELPWEED